MTELRGVARLKFHEGKLEEFKRLSVECMEIVRAKDTGTLQYEINLNEDESECIFIERFIDSEALIEHNANLGDRLGAMLATGTVSADVFGNPSDELRAMWEGSPVRIFTPLLSM